MIQRAQSFIITSLGCLVLMGSVRLDAQSSCSATNGSAINLKDQGQSCSISCAAGEVAQCSNGQGSNPPSCTCNGVPEGTVADVAGDAYSPFDIATFMMTNAVMKTTNADLYHGGLTKFLGYGYQPTQAEIDTFNAQNKPVMYKPFEATVSSLQYGSSTPNIAPNVLAAANFTNGTSLAASQQFADQKATTETGTWTFSNALSNVNSLTNAISTSSTLTQGQSTTNGGSFNVGFSFAGLSAGGTGNNSSTDSTTIASGQSTSQSSTITNTVSLSDTNAQTFTQTQTWSWNATVPVPANSTVSASVVVKEASISTRFTAGLRFAGVLWFEELDGSHVGIDTNTWFILYTGRVAVIEKLQNPNAVPTPTPFTFVWVSTIDPEEPIAGTQYVNYDLAGEFSGEMGIEYDVIAQETSGKP